jgi:tRNA-dihydrouridine synthase C
MTFLRLLLSVALLLLVVPVAPEFIRVPARSERPAATVRGLTAHYRADELAPVPLAAQLMGSSTELLAAAAKHLVESKRAPRIDLNCGEPQLRGLVTY